MLDKLARRVTMKKSRVEVNGKDDLIKNLREVCEVIGRQAFCEKTGMREPNAAVLLSGKKYYSTDKLSEIAQKVGLEVRLTINPVKQEETK